MAIGDYIEPVQISGWTEGQIKPLWYRYEHVMIIIPKAILGIRNRPISIASG